MEQALKTLGLSAGADYRDVELAYRSLIKQYHPDRPGGDAARATEINRAYTELRQLAWLSAPAAADKLRPAPPLNKWHLLGQGLFAASVLAVGGMLYWDYGRRAERPVAASASPIGDVELAANSRPSPSLVTAERPVSRKNRARETRAVVPPRIASTNVRTAPATASRAASVATEMPARAAARDIERPVPIKPQPASSAQYQPRPAGLDTATPSAPRVIPAWQRPLRQPWQRPLSTGERG